MSRRPSTRRNGRRAPIRALAAPRATVAALPPLDVRTERDPDSVVVHVAGEIDQDNAPQLGAALTGALRLRPERLHVDATKVSFCDCSGLHALLRARDRARETGAELTLATSQPLARLLSITGTSTLFSAVAAPQAG